MEQVPNDRPNNQTLLKVLNIVVSFLASVIATPFFIFLGVQGWGRGSPPPAMCVLFPYATLVFENLDWVPDRFGGFGIIASLFLLVVQVPMYGAIYGYSFAKERYRVFFFVAIAHVLAAAICRMIGTRYFEHPV